MKRLKIISKFIDLWRVRPLFVIVTAIVILDATYVNCIYKWPGIESADAGGRVTATVVGKVRDKAYDECGNVKNITVGNTLCYVNLMDAGVDAPPLGSEIKIAGDLKEIDGPMNPGEFDRKCYYGSKRIFYEMNADSMEIVDVPEFAIKERFLMLRRSFSARILNFFPLEGGTVNTLICADKTSLSGERKDLYTRVGVGHFLVISGLHISAVGTFIYKGLRRLGFKVRTGCIVAIIFLGLYGLLVGFSVSVIRATVMFAVRLLADVLKRVYDMTNAIAVAAVINIIINPLCVIDSAFIYSYTTVLSISVNITNRLIQSTKKKGFKGKVAQALKFPAFLWLFVMPVNLYLSYSCSVMSVVANSLLTPLSAPILVLAFVGFVFSFTGLTFPTGLADFLIALMLKGFDKLCKLISAIPAFSLSGKPAAWKMLIYYVLLVWLMFEGGKRFGKVLWTGVALAMVLFVATPRNITGQVTALYVGQGECVVVHTGVRSAAVYDCGSTSKTGVGEYILIPYLKAMGVSRIEGIFVSHGDLDHAGEVSYLCESLPKEGIRLESLYVQDIPASAKSKCLLEAERTASEHHIPVVKLSKGLRVRNGEFSFTCLWPEKGSAFEDANAGSMVILASRNGFDTLLMGDATKETERLITENASKVSKGHTEVLLVSHHGSDTASDSEFLKRINPRTALVSAGINNRYGHPHKEVLNRFKTLCPDTRLYRTDKSGAVSVFVKRKKLVVFPFLK